MIFVTILLTVLAVLAFQKALVRVAARSSDRDWLDDLYGRAYALCDAMGLSVPHPEPEDVEGLDRYPENGENPFIRFVTKIIVPDEYARQQVMLALRHLHDGMSTDTGYMAVNYLVHLYADEDGELTGNTPWIVVEDASDTKVGDIDTRNGELVVMRSNGKYTITVDGVVRHPGLSADSAVGAMCHYLHGAEYSLMKHAKREEDFSGRVERAAFALARKRTSGYGWSDKQFDAYWNSSDFAKRITAWGDGFRGTHKGHLMSEVEAVLRADAA